LRHNNAYWLYEVQLSACAHTIDLICSNFWKKSINFVRRKSSSKNPPPPSYWLQSFTSTVEIIEIVSLKRDSTDSATIMA